MELIVYTYYLRDFLGLHILEFFLRVKGLSELGVFEEAAKHIEVVSSVHRVFVAAIRGEVFFLLEQVCKLSLCFLYLLVDLIYCAL